MTADTDRVDLPGGPIEIARFGPTAADDVPTLVLLHEGLGSVSLWRDFPERLAARAGCPVLAYSRYGYGRSAPCILPRQLDYMHVEARAVLPALIAATGIGRHVLIGHSDGASIALIHAGDRPARSLAGVAVMAPHIFVEDVSVASIAAARDAWSTTDLRERLKRHHGANVDCAFLGWNDAWLDPAFRHWNVEEFLPRIKVPVLPIQGIDDEYGTPAQVETIGRICGVPPLLLAACGHSPHRDQPDIVLDALERFVHHLPA